MYQHCHQVHHPSHSLSYQQHHRDYHSRWFHLIDNKQHLKHNYMVPKSVSLHIPVQCNCVLKNAAGIGKCKLILNLNRFNFTKKIKLGYEKIINYNYLYPCVTPNPIVNTRISSIPCIFFKSFPLGVYNV